MPSTVKVTRRCMTLFRNYFLIALSNIILCQVEDYRAIIVSGQFLM